MSTPARDHDRRVPPSRGRIGLDETGAGPSAHVGPPPGHTTAIVHPAVLPDHPRGSRPASGRVPVVVAQHATKPFATSNRAVLQGNLPVRLFDQAVPEPRVRPFGVIVDHVFSKSAAQVGLAQRDDAVKALGADGEHEPLSVGVPVVLNAPEILMNHSFPAPFAAISLVSVAFALSLGLPAEGCAGDTFEDLTVASYDLTLEEYDDFYRTTYSVRATDGKVSVTRSDTSVDQESGQTKSTSCSGTAELSTADQQALRSAIGATIAAHPAPAYGFNGHASDSTCCCDQILTVQLTGQVTMEGGATETVSVRWCEDLMGDWPAPAELSSPAPLDGVVRLMAERGGAIQECGAPPSEP